jgi:alcohol dehydrogenase class IV
MPPLICLPTTGGTAADLSQFAIILNEAEKTKIAIVSKAVIPDLSLIDPEAAKVIPGLAQRGISRTSLPELALKAMSDPCMVTNPRRPNLRDVEVIYEEAL